MNTEDLIARLTGDLKPVSPLRPVPVAVPWLAGTTLFFVALVAMRAFMAGTSLVGLSPALLIPQVAAVAVGVSAAIAALSTTIPGTSRRVLVWPVLASAIWLGALLTDVVRGGSAVVAEVGAAFEWPCVAMIALGSLLPVTALLRVLQRGAPLTPRVTLAMVVLSATGLANVVSCLSHPHTSSAVLLVWHGVTVAVLVAVAALVGGSVLRWRTRSFEHRARI